MHCHVLDTQNYTHGGLESGKSEAGSGLQDIRAKFMSWTGQGWNVGYTGVAVSILNFSRGVKKYGTLQGNEQFNHFESMPCLLQPLQLGPVVPVCRFNLMPEIVVSRIWNIKHETRHVQSACTPKRDHSASLRYLSRFLSLSIRKSVSKEGKVAFPWYWYASIERSARSLIAEEIPEVHQRHQPSWQLLQSRTMWETTSS